jgi:hypothetical protein
VFRFVLSDLGGADGFSISADFLLLVFLWFLFFGIGIGVWMECE